VFSFVTVDASQAGHGDLEIMINEGTVPCSVQNRGSKRFHASFTPREPIPHRIHLRFNGCEVPGKASHGVIFRKFHRNCTELSAVFCYALGI